jgi:outer membrane lipoprotein SlyB
VLGLGMAIAVAPLTTVVMSAAGDRHGGVASGVNNAIARVAGMLAVAVLGAVAVGQFGAALERRLEGEAVSMEIRQQLRAEVAKVAEARVPQQVRSPERERLGRAMHESFLHSFRVVMLIASTLALLGAAAITWGKFQ